MVVTVLRRVTKACGDRCGSNIISYSCYGRNTRDGTAVTVTSAVVVVVTT